jgi:hypothetical protein
MKRRHMCPNRECERYGVETGLMGGCECGTALVPYAPPEPTNEQLENLMLVMGLPVVSGMADRNPAWREGMLNFHRLVGRCAQGDDEACERVAFYKAAFGRVHAA